MDMLGHPFSQEDNASACLRRCRMIPGCAHFSFYTPLSHCHIADAFATPQPARLGFISAPAGCVSGSGGHRTTVSTMLMQRHCFKNGVSYAPWFKAGEQLEAPKPMITTDVMDCQRRCDEQQRNPDTPDCRKFQFNVFTNVCHMMATVPIGQQVAADYLISGPPQCPGHIELNITIENVDFDKLNKTPDIKHLLEVAIENATLRDPASYNESKYGVHLLNIQKGGQRVIWHEFCTAEKTKKRNHSYNDSIIVSMGVYAHDGISFATAKLRDTHRCQIGTRVSSSLQELKSSFAPVMPPGSAIYVSAVSPVTAVGHQNLRYDQSNSPSLLSDGSQGSWITVGGARPAVASSFLLIALALCVSMSAASWRRQDRQRRGLALAAYSSDGYDPFTQIPRIDHQPLEGVGQNYHSQEHGQHDVLHFEAQSIEFTSIRSTEVDSESQRFL
jgi:hypothetical protein